MSDLFLEHSNHVKILFFALTVRRTLKSGLSKEEIAAINAGYWGLTLTAKMTFTLSGLDSSNQSHGELNRNWWSSVTAGAAFLMKTTKHKSFHGHKSYRLPKYSLWTKSAKKSYTKSCGCFTIWTVCTASLRPLTSTGVAVQSNASVHQSAALLSGLLEVDLEGGTASLNWNWASVVNQEYV